MRDKFEKHKMADGDDQDRECLRYSRGRTWEDEDFKDLLQILKEETIFWSLDNAKTREEKRSAHGQVHVVF